MRIQYNSASSAGEFCQQRERYKVQARHVLAYAWLAYLLLCLPVWAQNHVISLDGSGDYVELPSSIFAGLTEVTIEAWVKWERLSQFSQPFGVGNDKTWNVLALNNRDRTSDLQFFIYQQHKLTLVQIPAIIPVDEWCHIAAVSGPMGLRLYLNGVLVGKHPRAVDLASISTGSRFYLGRSQWADNEDFEGQIDEVRIWREARTGQQINATMFHRLAGSDDKLVGLWN